MSATDYMLRHRYGLDPSTVMAHAAGLVRPRPPSGAGRTGVAIAPGTPSAASAASPAELLALRLGPLSARPPQALSALEVYAVVSGPMWAHAAAEASRAAAQSGYALQISTGAGVVVSVAAGALVPTSYRFVPQGR